MMGAFVKTGFIMPIRMFLCLLLAMLLQACTAGLPGVMETPRVSVQDVALQNVSLASSSAVVLLNISNPNPFPLPLRGIDYSLRLNGRAVAGGQQLQQRNINAGETVPLAIPVQLQLSEVLGLLPGVLQNGQVQYELSGGVSLPFVRIPFARQGSAGVQR